MAWPEPADAALAHAASVASSRMHDWCGARYQVPRSSPLPEGWAGLRADVLTVASPQGIVFSLVSGPPQTLCRQASNETPALWLVLPVDGRLLLDFPRSAGAAPLELSPGDLLYGPAGLSCELMLPQAFRLLHVRVPRELLHPRLLDLRSLKVGVLPGSQGVTRLLAGLLRGIADTLDALDGEQLRPVETALAEFLIASLWRNDVVRRPGNARSAQFQRVCEAIETRLGDSELSLQRFAAEQRASPRYIQKLFGEAGSSFSGHLRERRLERCRADLASRAHESLSISEICFRWGFNDAAHFSRAFRAQFGTTPRGFRQAALRT